MTVNILVSVEIYNCNKLASSCGECLSYVNPKFNCGFCQSPEGFCTIESQCDHTFITNHPENVCFNPKILSFFPRSGPPTGKTLINITGENLGRGVDSISRVYIQTKGAKILCAIKPQLYMAAKSIVCETSSTTRDTEGTLVVELIMKDDKPYAAKSEYKFEYRSPRIIDFNPKFGPLDGGPRVIINGTNLDAGSALEIHVANYECKVVEKWAKWLVCITGAAKRVGERDKVRLGVDSNYIQQSITSFQYKPNPIVSKIEPLATIESGGVSVNVTGSNLDVVLFPKIRLLLESSPEGPEGTYKGPTGPC